MAETRPIIVIKKKVSHGGHHGGAWKVAYADFVTAMMALFIVLWLLNSSKQVREAVGGYFKDPTGKSKMVGNGQTGSGDNFTLSKDNMSKLKEELEKSMRKMTDFEKMKDKIEMTVTSEGLRIELLESDVGMFFQSGKGVPSDSGQEVLVKLAGELGKLPNKVFIEGHTDSKPYASEVGYTNWELSADRANSVRRLMQQNGLAADQVTQVRGYADQLLKKPDAPLDPSNRRISLIVQHLTATAEEADEKAEGGEGAKSEGHGEAKKAEGHGEAAKPEGHGEAAKPAAHEGAKPAEGGKSGEGAKHGEAAKPPAAPEKHAEAVKPSPVAPQKGAPKAEARRKKAKHG
jgi:chemotaxis protein MotB